MINPQNATWRKSSRSSNNGACVEVAELSSEVAVRDSKLDTTGAFPMLRMPDKAWTGLIAGIKKGDLSI